MRKTLYVLMSFLAAAFLVTSCLDDATETVATSDVLITSFAINDIETGVPALTAEGKDTTLIVTTTGSDYTFIIDQNANRIYNTDSLPVGTDITKVTTEISVLGYFLAYEKNQADTIWSSEDSLDFTNPITFKVYAYDGSTRSYRAQINVHQQDPDSLQWTRLTNANFGVPAGCRQKAVLLNEKIYVFADNNGEVQMTSTGVNDGRSWTALQTVGLEGADYASAIAFNGSLYLLAQNKLYTSTEGAAWTAVATDRTFTQLFAVSSKSVRGVEPQPCLYGVSNGQIVESADALAWTEIGEATEYFPTENLAYANCPLVTNPGIDRALLFGTRSEASDTTAVVWSKLSTETAWTRYRLALDNAYGCPKLTDLAVISYDGALYAFGGTKNFATTEPVEAFSQLYRSTDYGVTWKATTEKVMLPEEFANRTAPFSYVVDADNYIWVMWSGLGEVWKGRINRLGFAALPEE